MIIKFLRRVIVLYLFWRLPYLPLIFLVKHFSLIHLSSMSLISSMKHFAVGIIIYSSLKCRRSTLCDAKSLESDVEAGASSGMLIQVCFCETPNGRKHDLLSQSSWQKFRSRFRDTPSSFPNKTLVAVPFGTPKHFLRLRYTSPSQPEFLTFVVEFPLLFCTVTAMDVLIQKYRGKSRINH